MKFKKSSLMTKIIIILPAIAAVATLVTLQGQLTEAEGRVAELEAQVIETEQENQRLQTAIEEADTEEGIKALAREKLGFVESNEVVFYDIGG